MEKTCCRCRTEYKNPAVAFGRSKQKPDGFSSACKVCERIRGRQNVLNGSAKRCYWKNKEKRQASKKADYEQNKARHLAKMRRYYAENRESCLNREHRRYQANPDEWKARSRARKAKLRGGPGWVSAADIRKQFTAQGGLCYWCDVVLPSSGYHVDHVLPLKLSGEHSPENIVIACQRCNASKRAKHPADYNRDRWERFQRERSA